MLLNAILKLHDKIAEMPLGVNRAEAIAAAEAGGARIPADHRVHGAAAVMTETNGERRNGSDGAHAGSPR